MRSPAPTHRRAAALAVLAVLAVAGCGGDDSASDPPVVPTPTDPVVTDPGPTDPTPDETGADETDPDDPGGTDPVATDEPAPDPPATMGEPEIELVEIARLDQPVGVASRPGEPTVYVVEQPGRIVAVDPGTGATAVALDVTDLTSSQGERGLLGLAFHPSGELAYINYTDQSDATVVAEYAVSPDGTFDPATRRVLLEIEQPFRNHNGGHLTFGPDGHLYVGTGDGGSAGDPLRASLDVGSLLGKLLRIDPSPTAEQPYTIPDDNPFVGVEGAEPEIFSIGLRNPWKFAFDPVTGDLWIADVGQNEQEEINVVAAPGDGSMAGAGLSFGWSAFEGTLRFNEDQDPDGHVDPVLTYQNNVDGCSVSGGAPYRGAEIPELAGGYVYSDYCSGTIWAFDVTTGRNLVLGSAGAVTSVLPGPGSELYVTSHSGPLYRVVAAGG